MLKLHGGGRVVIAVAIVVIPVLTLSPTLRSATTTNTDDAESNNVVTLEVMEHT